MSVGKKPRKPLPRYTKLRSSPLRPKKRSPAETQRIYGPTGRADWVRDLPCIACGRTPSVNAHTENEGKSRKGHYSTVVPLCPDTLDGIGCHTKYDQHLAPFDIEATRDLVKATAARVEAMWQARSGLEPIAAVVPRVVAEILERNGSDD